MSIRPRRIDQVIPSIIEHDAVSNHTFEAQRLLREMGFVSEIYATIIGPGCDGRVHHLDQLSFEEDGSQWVLYQCSIGSPAAEVVARHPGTLLVDYHNITPASLVERWLPPLADEARLGRRQLIDLASRCTYALADSQFNENELKQSGFARTTVVPVLVEAGNYDAHPDRDALASLGRAGEAGGVDWLFVGQLAPHKAQHDVVRAFACYRQVYDPAARLHLVGREMGRTYRDALERFINSLQLSAVVDLPGSVSTAVLAAYYETADVFVCCSDHEGFCAPVIEAMAHRVPVVAYSKAAVTETVGRAGLLLDTKEPALVASAVHEVLSDATVREATVRAGLEQAKTFSLERARTAFQEAIATALTCA